MSIDRIASNSVTSLKPTYNEKEQQPQQSNVSPKQEEVPQENRKISKDYLDKAIKGVNEFLLPSTTSLHFQMHEKLEEYYVQVIDDRTKEVIREIPSKEFLDMYAAMRDVLGLVVDEKV